MHFKNKNGFSLIEAMIAIAIIGMILSPMFILETNVFNAVARIAEKFHRILLSKQFIFIASKEQPSEAKEFKLERKEEKPTSLMRYSFAAVDKKSSLAKLQGIYRQEVITSGGDATSPEGRAIQFVYKPERPQS